MNPLFFPRTSLSISAISCTSFLSSRLLNVMVRNLNPHLREAGMVSYIRKEDRLLPALLQEEEVLSDTKVSAEVAPAEPEPAAEISVH